MINTHELRAKAYELSAGVCRPADADRLVNELERSGELVRLEHGMWTTRTCAKSSKPPSTFAQQRATEIAAPVSETNAQAGPARDRQTNQRLAQPRATQALETITGPGGVT